MRITGNENNVAIMKELGQRIHDTRVSLMLKRVELAEKAGVSPSTIDRIEAGTNISLVHLLNILRTLNLLENVNLLIPEYELSPMDIVHGKTKRQRATTPKEKVMQDWIWGDEK